MVWSADAIPAAALANSVRATPIGFPSLARILSAKGTATGPIQSVTGARSAPPDDLRKPLEVEMECRKILRSLMTAKADHVGP